jgi:hypothetical protein
MARKNENRKLDYDEAAMKLGIAFYEKCELAIDLLYHLMKSKRLQSFSAILLHTEMEGLGEFLQRQKRKTDLLYPIDPEAKIYALLCQETQVDGGYYFIKRLTKLMEAEGSHEVHAAIIGVEGTRYPIRDLLFIILDTFIKANTPETEESIIYRTVK